MRRPGPAPGGKREERVADVAREAASAEGEDVAVQAVVDVVAAHARGEAQLRDGAPRREGARPHQRERALDAAPERLRGGAVDRRAREVAAVVDDERDLRRAGRAEGDLAPGGVGARRLREAARERRRQVGRVTDPCGAVHGGRGRRVGCRRDGAARGARRWVDRRSRARLTGLACLPGGRRGGGRVGRRLRRLRLVLRRVDVERLARQGAGRRLEDRGQHGVRSLGRRQRARVQREAQRGKDGDGRGGGSVHGAPHSGTGGKVRLGSTYLFVVGRRSRVAASVRGPFTGCCSRPYR